MPSLPEMASFYNYFTFVFTCQIPYITPFPEQIYV